MALVKLYANLRSVAGKKEINTEGSNLHQVLNNLVLAQPELESFLLENGSVRPRVIISLNGQTLSPENFLVTPVKDEDIIAIFPPVAGG